jgi:uncharacterized coiled-coil protein SlyX
MHIFHCLNICHKYVQELSVKLVEQETLLKGFQKENDKLVDQIKQVHSTTQMLQYIVRQVYMHVMC